MAVTTAAVIGVAASAGGAISSFSQSAKQGRMAEKAADAAAKNMAAAKKKAEKDFFAGLNVSTDAYDRAFKNNLQAQNQNIQALQEGDPRNLAAGIGLVQQQSDANTETTRLALQKDLEANAKMKADSKDAINQDLKKMDLGQAKDNELRAKEGYAAEAQQFSQGVSGVVSTMGNVAQLAPLFKKNATAQEQADAEALYLANQAGQ